MVQDPWSGKGKRLPAHRAPVQLAHTEPVLILLLRIGVPCGGRGQEAQPGREVLDAKSVEDVAGGVFDQHRAHGISPPSRQFAQHRGGRARGARP